MMYDEIAGFCAAHRMRMLIGGITLADAAKLSAGRQSVKMDSEGDGEGTQQHKVSQGLRACGLNNEKGDLHTAS